MGKKKASKSKKLRPLIESHIRQGNIVARDLGIDNKWEIRIGHDGSWVINENITVVVENDFRKINPVFLNSKYELTGSDMHWFCNELKQIIVGSKLGMYQSSHKKTNTIPGSYHERLYNQSVISAINKISRTLHLKYNKD